MPPGPPAKHANDVSLLKSIDIALDYVKLAYINIVRLRIYFILIPTRVFVNGTPKGSLMAFKFTGPICTGGSNKSI